MFSRFNPVKRLQDIYTVTVKSKLYELMPNSVLSILSENNCPLYAKINLCETNQAPPCSIIKIKVRKQKLSTFLRLVKACYIFLASHWVWSSQHVLMFLVRKTYR